MEDNYYPDDMANDPAFLFYPGDYLRDTQCLSEKTQVAYDRIMCEHMRNICISHAQFKFFTKRLSPDEIAELKMILTSVPGGFQISWVAESISKRKTYSESRRQNRVGKFNNTSSSHDEHMDNENENAIVSINDTEDEPTFEQFWNLYDKKVGDKIKLKKKWVKLSHKDRMTVMNYIPNYKIAQPEKRFRKNPDTFMNNKSWNDELIVDSRNKKPLPKNADFTKDFRGH